MDGFCPEQHVCDGLRTVYGLQPAASIAPHLAGASKRQTLAVAATLTEEAYGISLAKLIEGQDWGPRESFVLNVILIATWGVSCTMGAIVGAAMTTPVALAEVAPRYAELAPTAYAQIATAVIITAIMAPILTGWVDKKFCHGKEDLSLAGVEAIEEAVATDIDGE